MKKYWQFLITFVLVIFLSFIAHPGVYSQIDDSAGDKIDGFPVLLADETLFVIQSKVGSFSSEERAQTITNRLEKIAEDTSVSLNLLRIQEQEATTNIVIGNKILVTLTEADAKAAQITRTKLANEYLAKIKDSLQIYRQERSTKYLIRSAIYTVIATVILVLIQLILNKIFSQIYRLLDSWRETRIPSLRIDNVELVRASRLTDLLIRLVQLIRWMVVLFVLYVYFPLVFSFFPWTKQLGKNLFDYLFAAFEQVLQAFIDYLPNLFVLGVIILFTYYIIRFVKLIFGEIERGDISFPGFYREWAAPTYKLSFFLIFALAVVVAFPYLPGSDSPAFLGTFNNDDGKVVYGLNDFDEGVIADYQYDLWRMATSLILIARENGKSKKSDEKNYVLTFAKSYLKQLHKLRSSDQEEKITYTIKKTSSPLKDFIKEVDQDNTESRQAMLEKWTKKGSFNLSSEKLGKVSKQERKIITEAIEGQNGKKSQYRKTLKGSLEKEKSSYFHVLDVAERLLAGTGSLGTKRYYVMLEGKKSKGGDDLILDIKYQGTASAYPYLSKADRKLYCFNNEAERTVEAYRALANNTNDHLGWVKLPKMGKNAPAGYYSVRERTPEKDAYPALVSELKKSIKKLTLQKKDNFISMCQKWGKILATSHARADNDANKGRITYSFEKEVSKVTKGKEKEFCKLVYDVSADYANQVAKDYKYFMGWFNTLKYPMK